jgi:tRNA pseudouridine55 synthase
MSVFGLLNLNKPQGPTSHDLVAWVRRGTGVNKVGHAGTLDPMATGVLVLCLGPATRLSEYVMNSRKTYRARVRLGVETNTYDAEGEIVAENPAPISRAAVDAALDAFRGDIAQMPPMHSAIKRGGRKLYELARAGQEVERSARAVTIYRLELAGWDFPFLELQVECSPGVYIRSLAHDLGQALGVGAHLAALERAASGTFTVEDAAQWVSFAAAMVEGAWRDYLLPPDRALGDAPALHLSADEADHVRHGRMIPADDSRESLARAYDDEGRFFAVVARRGGYWTPQKVFI